MVSLGEQAVGGWRGKQVGGWRVGVVDGMWEDAWVVLKCPEEGPGLN